VVSAKRLAALVLGLLVLAGMSAIPAQAERPAGAALAPLGAPIRAHAAATHGPSVSSVLTGLRGSAAITEAAYKQDYATYVAAKHSLGHLSGTRRVELGAVLSNVQAIAAAGLLSASRLPAVFLTLERNRHWWTTEALLSSGERVSFPPSKLVWEYYPGQGIEIQWLASFGEGNGYYNSGHENANLRQLVGEMIALASSRAGGIAWEYLFHFDGGVPPWTSGLSQGTALQVLSRAWSRFKEPADLTAAQQALGIFKQAPPQGVRVTTKAGSLYAEYTYAPSDRILNGFIQADVGLYDYTAITGDPLGLKLFEAGDAEARAEVPHYDTGFWSLYDQYGESNLNYHELLTEFLQHLCERTRKGPPPTGTPAPAPAPAPTPPPTTTGPAGSPTGGAGAPTASAHAAAQSTQIAGDEIYCTTAQRFTEDLTTSPAVALLSTHLRGGTRAGVTISLSKISTVTLTVRKGSKTVWTNRATVGGGRPKLLWVTPTAGGSYSVTLTASDLAGNFSTAHGTIQLSHH
jgi:D-glucuronyl C5-epimerase C-terminus